MANIDAIIAQMLPAQQDIGIQIGTNLDASADPTLRAAVKATDALIAIVIGVLVDQGVLRGNGQPLTLATFSAALTAARAQTYTPVPPPAPLEG